MRTEDSVLEFLFDYSLLLFCETKLTKSYFRVLEMGNDEVHP